MKKEQVELRLRDYKKLQQDYNGLLFDIPLVSNMISIFLTEAKHSSMVGLEFFRSDMNNVVLTDIKLKNTTIKWSTFSSSTMTDSQFLASTIGRTYFSNSYLENMDFSNSKISTSLFSGDNLNRVSSKSISH